MMRPSNAKGILFLMCTNAHFRATVAPERGQLGPAGVQVPQSQTPEEFPATASSAMAHRVGLQPARTVNFLRSAFTKLL
ncbi:MAG: hypothetical protein ACJASX_003875 [Limisphaerales bacterium]|jgi:hypothetical protein